jgi:hypothetical protein
MDDVMATFIATQLHSLKATGEDGFEGLIAELLNALTGRYFLLARAGDQSGRDLRDLGVRGNVVAVECKRYSEGTSLRGRDLVGGMADAIQDRPDIDLWVLVTSRDVPDQVDTLLSKEAQDKGIEYLHISAGTSSDCPLSTLCAVDPDTVERFLSPHLDHDASSELQTELAKLAALPEFSARVDRLRQQFDPASIGYDNWRENQNRWLTSRFQSEDQSRAAFHQVLNVAAENTTTIERSTAWEQLDHWLAGWPEHNQPFVLTGEEGDGKTWAVASWLANGISHNPEMPPVVFVPSSHAADNQANELLASVIERQLGRVSKAAWKKRINRWLQSDTDVPTLLLVLDGINERHLVSWWRSLLEELALDTDEDGRFKFKSNVAVLITARTAYWRPFTKLSYLPHQPWALSPYDDEELASALALHNLNRTDIADALLPLVRKPRYLDLTIRFRQRMVESDDVTVTRLIYEDWRDRRNRKTDIDLDDDAFRDLLRDLAQHWADGTKVIRQTDVRLSLPLCADNEATLNELCTGGVLVGVGNKYQVDERRLTLGFGLLLSDDVKNTEDRPLDDVIHEWLEPHGGMDLKAKICGAAFYCALMDPAMPIPGRATLLHAWVIHQNPTPDFDVEFQAYFNDSPETYLAFAELIWAGHQDHPLGQELLLETLVRKGIQSDITDLLAQAFERWLGFIHPEGSPFFRPKEDEKLEGIRAEIAERIGRAPTPGPVEVGGFQLMVTEDSNLLRLGQTALAVISHLPREPFVRAIAAGCLAEALMGKGMRGDLTQWVIRSSPSAITQPVLQVAAQLHDADQLATHKAAYRLLLAEGSDQAHQAIAGLPEEIRKPNAWSMAHQKDPCTSGNSWTREECEICLQREGMPPRRLLGEAIRHSANPHFNPPDVLAQRLQPMLSAIDPGSIWSTFSVSQEDHRLEDLEKILSVCAPEEIANKIRGIVDTAASRENQSLRQMAIRLDEHALLFTDTQFQHLQTAWVQLNQDCKSLDQDDGYTEYRLFPHVLSQLDWLGQLEALLGRHPDVMDSADWTQHFETPGNWDEVRDQLNAETDPTSIQRIIWFLSASAEALPEPLLSDLCAHMGSGDTVRRYLVLRSFYYATNPAGRNWIINGDWGWHSGNHQIENHWGSNLLARYGLDLFYGELRNRIYPAYLPHAVRLRGERPDEVALLAEDLTYALHHVVKSAPDIPDEFPSVEFAHDSREPSESFVYPHISYPASKQGALYFSRDAYWGGRQGSTVDDFRAALETPTTESLRELAELSGTTFKQQLEAGNAWFREQFQADDLAAVYQHHPRQVYAWIVPLLDTDTDVSQYTMRAQSFFEAICELLLTHDPEKGAEVYRAVTSSPTRINVVDNLTGMRLVDLALFRAPDSGPVRELWDNSFDSCTTDYQLLYLAYSVQKGGTIDWLMQRVELDLNSEAPFDQARALTVLGFIDDSKAVERLAEHTSENPITWLERCARAASSWSQSNQWATHWFSEFLRVPDDDQAWAAFRLFQNSVDCRFLLHATREDWPDKGSPADTLERRWAFLEMNDTAIKKSIENNEKALKKSFIGQKTHPRQAHPWMGDC